MLLIGALIGPEFELEEEVVLEFGYLGTDVVRPDKALLLLLVGGFPPDPTPIPVPLLEVAVDFLDAIDSRVAIPRPLTIELHAPKMTKP
jgi:hypothetical protein